MQGTGGPAGVVARTRCAIAPSNPVRSPFQVNYGNRARYIDVTGAWEDLAAGWRNTGTGREAQVFATEVARVHASGALGESGRLRELFDYLAERGPAAGPATQADIADAVFGQPDTEGDDATARVYIHRLRKRLEDFYAGGGEGPGGVRLVLPAGTYALRLADPASAAPAAAPAAPRPRRWLYALALAGALGLAFLIGRMLPGSGDGPPGNALWEPFLASDRPIMVVVGDYYMFGEYNEVEPEQSRLIRDFRINSPMDLAALQEAEPARYGNAEDVGLTYLPLSAAYALREIVPILSRGGRRVEVVPASEFEADSARDANVVYVGLLSAMRLLEDRTFAGSTFRIGENYDELIDRRSDQLYRSEEAHSLASPVSYRDYGYVARFEGPGGALVAVVAGARDTALRGLGPIVAGEELPAELDDLAGDEESVEALFQINGQQGADLSERLLVARARR